MHPTEHLLEMQELDPNSFAANYMNAPLDDVLEGTYYERQIERILQEKRYGEHIQFNPNKTVYTFWDLAVNYDLNAVWFVQINDDGEYNVIDYWEGTKLSVSEIAAIIDAKPYVYEGHFAPHDVLKTHLGSTANKTTLSMYQEYGINFSIVGKNSVEAGRQAVMLLLHKCHFSNKTAKGFNHLKSYRAKLIPNTGGLSKEVHDVHSHGADAFRYFAVWVNPKLEKYTTLKRVTLRRLGV
jgi:hypothetical protein